MTTLEPSIGSPQQRYFDNPGTNQNYSMNGRIVIFSLAVLCFIILIILFLHMYAKWFWRSSANIRQRLNGSRFSQETSETRGLDTEIVVALPVFTYMSQLSMVRSKAVECAVCLSEFRQYENCKFLPKCKHFFHTDCIDMWFLGNTTCPLCRATAEQSVCDELDHQEEACSRACSFKNLQDGVNEHGEQHKELLGFTSSGGLECGFGIRDDLAGGNINGDEEQGNEDGGILSRHHLSQRSQAATRGWRRSISDKFPYVGHVLFWGNHSHVTAHMNPGHWRTGGRSLPHITMDIVRSQERLVEVSTSPSLCSSSEPHPLLLQSAHSPPSPSRLKSLKRLLSK